MQDMINLSTACEELKMNRGDLINFIRKNSIRVSYAWYVPYLNWQELVDALSAARQRKIRLRWWIGFVVLAVMVKLYVG